MGFLVKISFLRLILVLSIGVVLSQNDEVEYVYNYRVINWCIVGRAEHDLFEWPLSQLKPFLLRTQGLNKYEDFMEILDPIPINKESAEYPIYKANLDAVVQIPEPPPPEYKLEFKQIKCTEEDFIGYPTPDPSTFHNRAHIQLTITNPADPNFDGVEGLVIQANHAPFGIGFPFGQFDQGEDVQCDCAFLHARVIPCISRPDTELLTPTVGVFHFNLPRYVASAEAVTNDRTYPKSLQETGKQSEFHFHFKWHDTPCSPAATVEFWVLIVHDFFRRKFEVKKFGPYSNFRSNLYNPSPEFHNAPTPGNRLKWTYTDTTITRYIQQPIFMPSPLFPRCRESIVSPPNCVPVNADMILINPNLKLKECDVKYFVECHSTGDYFTPALEEDLTKSRIRFNGEFDTQCISKYPLTSRAGRQCPAWTGKMRCFGDYSDLRSSEDAVSVRKVEGPQDPFFPDSFCLPCKYEPTTEFQPTEDPGIKIFTRTLHGVLMILAFFYVLPLSIIMGRYYKETFHFLELKGWRLWLWVHVGSSMLLMLLSYAAYNLPTFWELDKHMYWGYGALFSGLLGLISGWGREKSWKGLKYMLLFHASTGYITAFCAGVSFHESAATTVAKGIIIFTQVACLLIMIALSIHVCSVDNQLGMKPPRSHFPVMQVRFEDSYIPGQKFRQMFFYVLCGVLFVIIFVTFCV